MEGIQRRVGYDGVDVSAFRQCPPRAQDHAQTRRRCAWLLGPAHIQRGTRRPAASPAAESPAWTAVGGDAAQDEARRGGSNSQIDGSHSPTPPSSISPTRPEIMHCP